MRTIAVILAGGVGSRVGQSIPKQLLKIAGKPIVEHTLETLNDNPNIDEIIIMMNRETLRDLDYLAASGKFSKLTRILPGGSTRNETSELALQAIEDEDGKVLFHDAVRPFINHHIIDECVKALETFRSVDTAIPSADTIIEIGPNGCISSIPDRSLLRRGQTPQGFHLKTIREAYRLAGQDPSFSATDDCGVVFKYLPGEDIFVVLGSDENMKITEPIDLHIADKLFQLKSTTAPSNDAAAGTLANQVVVVFGGSYGIGESVVSLARQQGAEVFPFSRSLTNTDVTDRPAVERALQEVKAQAGRIDHVVVTAGVLTIAPLVEAAQTDIETTISTNLIAPAIIARSAFPFLADTQGSLTFFTSSSYTRGRAGYSLYSATKAGVVNLTQALAEEWAESSIRVNSINPQRTGTPMRTAAFGKEPEDSLLTADQVAQATVYTLDSDLTGQIVNVRI